MLSLFSYLCPKMRNVSTYIIIFILSVFSFCMSWGEKETSSPLEYECSIPVGQHDSLQASDTDEPLWLFAMEGASPSMGYACASQPSPSWGDRASGVWKSVCLSERFCSNFFRMLEVCCRKNDRVRRSQCRGDGYYVYSLRKIII